jgi:hypothetical protein
MIRIDAWRQNLELLEAQIQNAISSTGRDRSSLRVVVVTKTHPADIIEELLELGVSDIGESYLQEAVEKMDSLENMGTNLSKTNWHMIGHIQSRKAKEVAANFNWVHSVDSLKLARRLDRAAKDENKRLKVLVQVNISGELSKFGFAAKLAEDRDNLLESMKELISLSNLDVLGLMSIPPFDEEKAQAKKIFHQTIELRDYLEGQFPENPLPELSMGMSNDFQEAIIAGATIIRVGSAILGPRPKSRS